MTQDEDDYVTITIRTNDKDLYRRLKAFAKKNDRSLNREAARLLKKALDAEEPEPPKSRR